MGNTDPLNEWPSFVETARARLDQGRIEYGDKSFSESPAKLAAEIEQECLDMACWGYVLWHRVKHLRESYERAAANLEASK